MEKSVAGDPASLFLSVVRTARSGAGSYTLWCFNTVGRKILTLGEGFTTQVVTLWCFNTVGRKILTLGEGFTTKVQLPYGVSTQ